MMNFRRSVTKKALAGDGSEALVAEDMNNGFVVLLDSSQLFDDHNIYGNSIAH